MGLVLARQGRQHIIEHIGSRQSSTEEYDLAIQAAKLEAASSFSNLSFLTGVCRRNDRIRNGNELLKLLKRPTSTGAPLHFKSGCLLLQASLRSRVDRHEATSGPAADTGIDVLINFNYDDSSGLLSSESVVDALTRAPAHPGVQRLVFEASGEPPRWMLFDASRTGHVATAPDGDSVAHCVGLERLSTTFRKRREQRKGRRFRNAEIMAWCIDVAEAQMHLLEHGVQHRAINLDTVMWDVSGRRDMGRAVLSRFEHALVLPGRRPAQLRRDASRTSAMNYYRRAFNSVSSIGLGLRGGKGGPQQGLAPEVLDAWHRCESRFDVPIPYGAQPEWELGVFMYQLLVGQHPFGQYPHQVFNAGKDEMVPVRLGHCAEALLAGTTCSDSRRHRYFHEEKLAHVHPVFEHVIRGLLTVDPRHRMRLEYAVALLRRAVLAGTQGQEPPAGALPRQRQSSVSTTTASTAGSPMPSPSLSLQASSIDLLPAGSARARSGSMNAGALDWDSLRGEDSSMIDFLLGESRSQRRETSALNLEMQLHEPSARSGSASGARTSSDDSLSDGRAVVAVLPSDLTVATEPLRGMQVPDASKRPGNSAKLSTGLSVQRLDLGSSAHSAGGEAPAHGDRMHEDDGAHNAESGLLRVVQERDPMDSIRRSAAGVDGGPPQDEPVHAAGVEGRPPQLLLGGLSQLPSLHQCPDLFEGRESTTSPPVYDGWCRREDQAFEVASHSQPLSEGSEIGDLSQALSESSADTGVYSSQSIGSCGSPRAGIARYDAGTSDERLRSHSAASLGYADLAIPQDAGIRSATQPGRRRAASRQFERSAGSGRCQQQRPSDSVQHRGVPCTWGSGTSAVNRELAQSMELDLGDLGSINQQQNLDSACFEGDLGSGPAAAPRATAAEGAGDGETGHRSASMAAVACQDEDSEGPGQLLQAGPATCTLWARAQEAAANDLRAGTNYQSQWWSLMVATNGGVTGVGDGNDAGWDEPSGDGDESDSDSDEMGGDEPNADSDEMGGDEPNGDSDEVGGDDEQLCDGSDSHGGVDGNDARTQAMQPVAKQPEADEIAELERLRERQLGDAPEGAAVPDVRDGSVDSDNHCTVN